MMEEIVVAEDDLRRLEKRFGPEVRLMGAWNSDGTSATSASLYLLSGRPRTTGEPRVDHGSISPCTQAGAHHRVPRNLEHHRFPLDRTDRRNLQGILVGRNEQPSRT